MTFVPAAALSYPLLSSWEWRQAPPSGLAKKCRGWDWLPPTITLFSEPPHSVRHRHAMDRFSPSFSLTHSSPPRSQSPMTVVTLRFAAVVRLTQFQGWSFLYSSFLLFFSFALPFVSFCVASLRLVCVAQGVGLSQERRLQLFFVFCFQIYFSDWMK